MATVVMNAYCYKTLRKAAGNNYWDMQRHCYNSQAGCNSAYATAFSSRRRKVLKSVIKKYISLMDLE